FLLCNLYMIFKQNVCFTFLIVKESPSRFFEQLVYFNSCMSFIFHFSVSMFFSRAWAINKRFWFFCVWLCVLAKSPMCLNERWFSLHSTRFWAMASAGFPDTYLFN